MRSSSPGRMARALLLAVKSEAGLIYSSSILLLAVILAAHRHLAALAGGVLLACLGLLVLAVVLRRTGMIGSRGEESEKINPRLLRVGITGIVAGLIAFIILTFIGDQGWTARLLVIPAAGLWVISGGLGRSGQGHAFYLSPLAALLSLILIMVLGYTTGAGLIYFVGPPLALCLLLAGHYLAGTSPGHQARGLTHYLDRAYLVAALVVTLSAWVDLG